MIRKKLSSIVLRIEKVIEALPERDQDILKCRFGIDCEAFTLAALGDRYGVTRERIRQIQDYALRKFNRIASCNDKLFYATADFETYVLKNGGLVSCDTFEEYLYDLGYLEKEIPLINLLVASGPGFKIEGNKVLFKSCILLSKIRFTDIRALLNSMYADLKKSNTVQNIDKFAKRIQTPLDLVARISALNLDRRFVIKDNKVSLLEWRNINPRTLADKIDFVLNDLDTPIHFKDICNLIENKKFDQKNVSENAVHNELINNDKFVLVGRGLYAKKEWGYVPGTVSDIILQILSKNGPMHIYDIKKEVLQRRKVKEITVQVNLNSSKDKFRKNVETGKYELV
jgi:hypothetical protein